jgi:hypothetical protein
MVGGITIGVHGGMITILGLITGTIHHPAKDMKRPRSLNPEGNLGDGISPILRKDQVGCRYTPLHRSSMNNRSNPRLRKSRAKRIKGNVSSLAISSGVITILMIRTSGGGNL